MRKEQFSSLAEFSRTWRERDRGKIQDVDWTARFITAGYHKVVLTDITVWQEVHEWCKEEIGGNHYSWSGSNFWFENTEDAFRFTLRWGGN